MDQYKFDEMDKLFNPQASQVPGAELNYEPTPQSVFYNPSHETKPIQAPQEASPVGDDTEQETVAESKPSASPAAAPVQHISQSQSNFINEPDWNDLSGQMKDIAAKKQENANVGFLADNLSNRQSFGNFFLGRMNPQNSTQGLVNASNEAAEAPIQNQAQLMDLMSRYQKAKTGQIGLQNTVSENDPNSDISKALTGVTKSIASKYGIDTTGWEKLPASQQGAMLDKQLDAAGKLEAARLQASIMNSFKRERLDQTAELNAQGQVAKAETSFVPRLEGATRIRSIFNDIQSGKIKSNEAAKSLIVAEMQRLETGASNPAYEGQVQKEMGTKAQQLGEFLQSWSGAPKDTVPPKVLKQLEEMTKSFTTDYQKAADSSFDVLKAGALPSQLPVIQAKHDALKQTYKKRLGGWYDDKKEAPANSSDHSEALAWAKNPNSPGWTKEKADIILKMNGVQ